MKNSKSNQKKEKQSSKSTDGKKEIPKYKQEEKARENSLQLKNSGPLAQKQFKKKM